jgi:hypothetical protein
MYSINFVLQYSIPKGHADMLYDELKSSLLEELPVESSRVVVVVSRISRHKIRVTCCVLVVE